MPDHNQKDLAARSPAEMHDWPELLAKTLDDAAKLFGAELHLVEANLRASIEAQMHRLVGILIAVSALAYGLLFVLAAVAILLHMVLPWWLAIGATGAGVILLGVIAQLALFRVAQQKTQSG